MYSAESSQPAIFSRQAKTGMTVLQTLPVVNFATQSLNSKSLKTAELMLSETTAGRDNPWRSGQEIMEAVKGKENTLMSMVCL